MSINRTSLSFLAENQNMWGTGTAGVNQTWEMWALNQHLTWGQRFGIDLGVASASIGVSAAADVKLGLVATLQGTTGDVDINYSYLCDIYSPDVALAGSQVEISTANWWANYQSIVSTSPNFQFDLGLAYQFDVNAALDYQYDLGRYNWGFLGSGSLGSGSGNLWSTSFGTNGIKTLPIVHLGMNPDAVGTTANYFDFKLFDYESSLAGDTSFNFDNWLGLPVKGFLSLPRGVQTSATNTTPTQSDTTLGSYGKGSAFIQFGVDSDQLVGYFFGFDTSKLEGDFSLPLGAGNLHYTLLDVDLVAEASLAQKFTFNPENIIIDMTSSLGENKRGILGDSFLFNTPVSGTGDLTFSTNYYLSGTLTNNTGVNGTVLVDLDVLNFEKWALIDKQIPLLSSDMWLFNKDIPVDLGYQHNDFAVHYSDDVARGSGSNSVVLGSDNSIEFDITRISDLRLNLTGLDTTVGVTLYFTPIGMQSNQYGYKSNTTEDIASGKAAYTTELVVSRNDLPVGHYKIVIQEDKQIFNIMNWANSYTGVVQLGALSAPGFNIDYTITRTNHAPNFEGNTTPNVQENHSYEYNCGNAFYDQDVANGDSLNFTITQANGNSLPTWMLFNAATKTIVVTPPTGAGDVTLHIVATDEAGMTANADIAFITPSPTDNAGNTIATARALGTLSLNNARIFYNDYVGIDDDAYDYYSFNTTITSDVGAVLSNITGDNLDAALLAADGTVLNLSTFNSQQERLTATNLVAGNYVVRVNAVTGHNDYQLSIQAAAFDGGGSAAAPTLVPLKVGIEPNRTIVDHWYNFHDYLSSGDTLDSYQFTFDTPTYVGFYNLDTSVGFNNTSHGYSGVFSGNGVAMDWQSVQYQNIHGDYYDYFASNFVSAGTYKLDLSPASWYVSTTSIWHPGYPFHPGYYTYVDNYDTYTGFTNTAMVIDRLPTVANPIADQSINVAQPFYFAIANNTFQDLDSDVMLSITATLADGSALPSWLVFDSSTLTFSGQLENLVAPIDVKLKAVFNGEAPVSWTTVTDTFTIAPTVIDSVGNSTATAQTINVSNQTALNRVPSTDGNDYFALQLDHAAPLAIQVNGVSTTTQVTLLSSDGTELQTATANSEGRLQLITTALTTGQYFLHLQTSASPNGYLLSIDGNYQVAPSSQPVLANESDTGLFDNDKITHITTPVITGNATANAIIIVFDGSDSIGQTNADNTGAWRFTTPTLGNGSHVLTTKVQDVAGNLSVVSDVLNVTVDSQLPDASTQPVLTEILVAELSDKPISILTGASEVGSTVYLYDENVFMGAALADNSGLWRFAMPELADGIHTIKATVIDVAGNESTPTTVDITAVNYDTVEITTADKILMGNSWFNTVSFANATQAISLNLASTTEQSTGLGNETIIGIEGAIGSQFSDIFQGSDAKNIFDGGLGVDLMAGGKNDDVYLVDNMLDIVSENRNEGTDSIITSTVNYKLGANIENLGILGTVALNGIVNNLNNTLVGNSSKNSLNGSVGNDMLVGNEGNDVLIGGVGNDSLDGGLGNDIYIIDAIGDNIKEAFDSGVDSVKSSVSFTLADNLENITLTGKKAINGTGNILNNIMTGNIGSNSLDGDAGDDKLLGGLGDDILIGGQGKDILSGGSGADIFKFYNVSELDISVITWDTIVDFRSPQKDKIDLSEIDSDTVITGNNAFASLTIGETFSGSFANRGDLYFDKTNHILYGNTDTNASADFLILLSGITDIKVTDFVL